MILFLLILAFITIAPEIEERQRMRGYEKIPRFGGNGKLDEQVRQAYYRGGRDVALYYIAHHVALNRTHGFMGYYLLIEPCGVGVDRAVKIWDKAWSDARKVAP